VPSVDGRTVGPVRPHRLDHVGDHQDPGVHGDGGERVLVTGSEGVAAAKRLGTQTFDRTTEVFRSVDLDGDGIPDRPRALTAVADAGSAINGAAAGAVGAVGNLLRRKRDTGASPHELDSEPAVEDN